MPNSYTSAFGSSGNGLPLTGGTITGNVDVSGSVTAGSNVIATGSLASTGANVEVQSNAGLLRFGAGGDVVLTRGGAAATLQLGSNAASTATAQTIKAHNVTTGKGADLILKGGDGSSGSGHVIVSSFLDAENSLLGIIESYLIKGPGLNAISIGGGNNVDISGPIISNLQFGGTTSSYPAIKRTNSDIEFVKADNTVLDTGIILGSPNGTRYRISVSNLGVITSTAI